MHLDEEKIQRLMHGELAPTAATSARAHITACAECHERAAQLEREEAESSTLLRQLDHSPPRVHARMIAARASTPRHNLARWAAGIALTLAAAGAAYALPGSPVPGWVRSMADRLGDPPKGQEASAPPSQTPDSESVGGIGMIPGQDLVILFTSAQSEGSASVSLTDADEVSVRASSGTTPPFTSEGEDRLVIDNNGSSLSYEIQIPRDAPRVEVRVGERRVFLKEGLRITSATTADPTGRYTIPLSGAR